MKKFILLLVISAFIYSCGGGSDKPTAIQASYSDTPGPDSSVLLPPKIEKDPDSNISPITGDTLKPVE